MNVEAVMDEIAERVAAAPTLAGRTYGWPNAKLPVPAAAVTYPPKFKYDETYGRGVDTMDAVLVVIVGPVGERQTRAMFGRFVNDDSAECIKTLVDGDSDDYESCDGVTVVDWETDTHTIGTIDHLAIVYALAIAGPGTA